MLLAARSPLGCPALTQKWPLGRAENLTQIKVALASVCFAVIGTVLGIEGRAPKAQNLRPLGWAAFFLAILAGVPWPTCVRSLPTCLLHR
jgi:hypothetical protein